MELKTLEIINFKGVEYASYPINGNSEFQIVGGFGSGKTTACEALQLVGDLVTDNLSELPETGNATVRVTLSGDHSVTYEVLLNQLEIRQENLYVDDELCFAIGKEQNIYPFESKVVWPMVIDEVQAKSAMFHKAVVLAMQQTAQASQAASASSQAYKSSKAFLAFLDFFNRFDMLTMGEIHRISFRFGMYKLCGNSPLNQSEFEAINFVCKRVSPDLYLKKLIDNGETDNYCEFIFKLRWVGDYSPNVRMILAALMTLQEVDLLVLDDVPYPVVKVIKEHMPKNKQLIYTGYSHNIGCEF